MQKSSENHNRQIEQFSQSDRLLEQLSRNSTPYHDPLDRVNWSALNQTSFWLPEEAISLYGLPVFDELPMEQRRALSHYEFMSFIEAGIWLESLFMERISRSLKKPRKRLPELIYHLHELREEAGHSLMFLELLKRSGPMLPNTRFYRYNMANMLALHAPFNSVGFWVAVLVGEEVPDRMNRFIRKHREKVCPTIYDIVSTHIIDEARHIAHARDALESQLSSMRGWQKKLVQPIIQRVFRQFIHAFYFPSPHVYELAGLSPGTDWARKARNNPHRIKFVDHCVQSSLRSLRQHGINLDWK